MNEPDKIVELLPSEWHSEREKPREPIFGPGLPDAIAYAIGFVIVFSVLYWIKN
jgi:hypothetical protein